MKVMTMRMMNWTSLGVMTASRATTAAWAVTAAPVWRSPAMMRWQSGKLESSQPLPCTSHPQAGSRKTVAPNQVLPETFRGSEGCVAAPWRCFGSSFGFTLLFLGCEGDLLCITMVSWSQLCHCSELTLLNPHVFGLPPRSCVRNVWDCGHQGGFLLQDQTFLQRLLLQKLLVKFQKGQHPGQTAGAFKPVQLALRLHRAHRLLSCWGTSTTPIPAKSSMASCR